MPVSQRVNETAAVLVAGLRTKAAAAGLAVSPSRRARGRAFAEAVPAGPVGLYSRGALARVGQATPARTERHRTAN